jgi:hypothetical protein
MQPYDDPEQNYLKLLGATLHTLWFNLGLLKKD